MEDKEEKEGMFEQGGAGRMDGDGEEDEDEDEEAGEEAEPIDVKTWRRAEKDLRVLQRAMPRIEYLHDMLWQHAMAREAAAGEGGGVEGREGDPSRAAGSGLGEGMGPTDPPTAPRPPVAPVDLSAFFAEMPVGKYVRVYGLVRVAWTGEKVELLREHVAAGARMRELPPVLLAAFFPEEAVSAWGKMLQDMLDHLRILEVVLDAPQGTGAGRDAAGVEGYRGSTGQSRQWAVVGKDTFTRELQIDLKAGPEEGGAGVGMRRDGREEGEGLVGEGGAPDWCSSRLPWAQTLGTIHVKLELTLVASVDTSCLSQAPTGLSSSKEGDKAVSGGGGAREERADQEEGEDGTGSGVEGKPAPGPRPLEPPTRQRRKLSFDLRHAEAGLLDLKRYWETLRTLALGERPSRQVLHAIQTASPVATGFDAESGGGGAGKEGGQDRDGPGLPILDGSGRRPLAEERTRFRLPDALLRLLPHLTQTKVWAEKARNLTKKKWPRRAGPAGARAAFGACLVAGAAKEEAEDAMDVKRARRGTSRSEAGKAGGASENREWEAAALADELHEADGEGEADTEGEEVAPPPIPAFMPPVPSPAMATSAASSVLPLPPRVPGTFTEAAHATRVPAKRRKTGDMGDEEESFGRAAPRRARAGSLGDGSHSLRSEEREEETAPARPPLLGDEFDEALMEAYVRQRAMYGSRLGRKRTPEVLLEVEELVGEQGAEGAPGVDNTDRVAADGRGRLSADGGREGGGRWAKVGPPRGRRFRMQWEAVVEKTGRPRMACLRRLEALLRSSETASRVLARLRAAQLQEAGQGTERGDREACYAAIQDTTPCFAATLVKVKQGLAVAGDPSLVRARRRALAGLPAEAIRRSFRELWDDGWLVEESCQVPGGGEEKADWVREEDGGEEDRRAVEGERAKGERRAGTLTLSRRFDDAMMKGAALYPQGFFRALGSPLVERTSQDVGTWPSGAVCRLVESFGHALLGPHGRDGGWRRGRTVPRAQDIGDSGDWPGRRFLDLDIAPRQQGASPLLGRGFVTEPLSRVSVTLGGHETLGVEEGATEELEGAVNILMWGQETWRPADGEEGEMEDRREERLPEGFAELISLIEKASVDGVSFQDLCRDMASIRAALQEGVAGLDHEGKPDDGIAENLVRRCLDEGIRRGRVLRVPSFFGPRFVSRTQATPWMMVAAPGSATEGTVEDADAVSASGTASIPDHSSNRRQKESFPATRLALPWLTIPDGQLHVFLLLRALRSLIAAIHTHPGISWTAVRSDYLPMFSFSEVLLLLRVCVAARVVELKRVRQGRRTSLWEEGRRRMVACLGPDWKYFDDLQARPERCDRNGMGGDKEERDERGEEDRGERDVLVALPGVQSMTRLGSLEAAIRAAGPKSAVSSGDHGQEDKNRDVGLEGM
ncbi:hypothetical protein NSK_002200 [Nannochloropsis salina CCMP1776]|uniref:Uncharacterized protein n=1 Tax=Nannochloropsis salina CCMP1776 TaxID=1027361 RepID=A0A4D9D971_9STRA|nr:hypothetical protein NSK_002200 [Nannochloropsis salina CCMP1776]|eukprot:TFJ86543.1 hypothetical protein NSK_002200 [Nannochloropsis salina CCMP1776]